MSNSELSLFNTPDGVEVVISRGDGETFATQAGYARMSGISKQAVHKRCKGLTKLPLDERQSLSGSESERVNRNYILQGKVDTSQGLQSCLLIPEPTILNWLSKDNPQLLTSFAQLGLRATLHRWAGFEVGSSAFQVPQDYASALRLAADEYECRISAEQNLSQAESTLEQYRAILSPGACPV